MGLCDRGVCSVHGNRETEAKEKGARAPKPTAVLHSPHPEVTLYCSTQAGEQATLHVGFQEAFRSKPNSQLKFLQEVELIHHLDFYLIEFANEVLSLCKQAGIPKPFMCLGFFFL